MLGAAHQQLRVCSFITEFVQVYNKDNNSDQYFSDLTAWILKLPGKAAFSYIRLCQNVYWLLSLFFCQPPLFSFSFLIMMNSWKPNPPCVVSLQVTLEKVLGITSSGNSSLACDPRSGLVAYPAGWDERDCLCAVIILIWPLTYQRSARSQLPYHIYLMRMFSVQISACVCYLCIISEDWSSVGFFFFILSLGRLSLAQW